MDCLWMSYFLRVYVDISMVFQEKVDNWDMTLLTGPHEGGELQEGDHSVSEP